MFYQLGSFFGFQNNPESTEPLTTDELRKATAAVLLAAARLDGTISKSEATAIVAAVQKHLHLGADKAAQLIQAATTEEASFEPYIATMREKVSSADRERVLTCAWAVILEDKTIAKDEGKFAVDLRQSLGLSMEQSVLARKEAEGISFDGFKELVDASQEMIDKTAQAASHGHILDSNNKLKP